MQLTQYKSGGDQGALDTLLAAKTLDLSKISKKSHLVFSEYLWGIKDKENFIFNPQKYAVLDFMDESEEGEVLGDTVVKYYSDGRREVVPAANACFFSFKPLCWRPKGDYGSDGYWADMSKMLTMFPKDKYLRQLDEKYPYLRENARFRLDSDFETYSLAMPLAETNWIYGSFNRVLEENTFSSLGGLQKFFKAFVQVIKSGSTEYSDRWMEKQGIVARNRFGEGKCRLYVGYAGLSYQIANTILSRKGRDTKSLRKIFLEHGEPLNLTYGMTVVAGKECNDFSRYSESLGCPVSGDYMFEPEVFEAWAADFTPAELSVINRERYFYYLNPDKKDSYAEQLKTIKSGMRKDSIYNQLKKYKRIWDF